MVPSLVAPGCEGLLAVYVRYSCIRDSDRMKANVRQVGGSSSDSGLTGPFPRYLASSQAAIASIQAPGVPCAQISSAYR